MDKKNIIIGVLGILVLLSAGYYGYNYLRSYENNLQVQSYQVGYFMGYNDTMTKIIESAYQCIPIGASKLGYPNITIIAKECLRS